MLQTAPDVQALGRLFFTPAQRQQLESSPVSPEGEDASTADELHANGWLRAQGDRPLFWFDGRLYREGEPALRPRLEAGTETLLWRRRRLRLRPGQTARLQTDGALIVKDLTDE
ncbi:hypothetical protein MIT9_P0037 [Methylomarinovum caldicuralii]|uniref:Uncharacterized protein n=2 Tax=Methylomarinovum caldicuralii TaxID=438856 RepID=A0AAU9C7R5_9GAMM|nr:hypothetical protein MIT9_P0037 [Methylomarinovum caldicuralii]